MLLLEDKN